MFERPSICQIQFCTVIGKCRNDIVLRISIFREALTSVTSIIV